MSREDRLISFYKQCVNKGYTNMADDTQSLKAKVIAMDLKLRYKTIDELFAEAKSAQEKRIAKEEKQQQQREAEAARLAVDGEWIMTLYTYAGDDEKDKAIAIYRRPDKSVYYTINNGQKVDWVPGFFVEEGSTLSYKYNPAKIVYTGATVGGIHTGGTHIEEASMTERTRGTGKGKVMLRYSGETVHIKRAKFPDIVVERFKREPIFKNHFKRGYYSLVASYHLKEEDANLMRLALEKRDTYTYYTFATSAMANMLHTKSVCNEMVSFLERVLRGDFPKSDEEIYNSAAALPASASAADIKHAIEELQKISGYKPADELLKKLQPRYEDVLQHEKEKKVLQREQAQKKRRIVVPIVTAIVVLAIAAVLVVTKVVIPSNKYNQAVALMESGKYDDAIASFEALGDYKDSATQVNEIHLSVSYAEAEKLLSAEDYTSAISAFEALGDYKDSSARADTIREELYTDAVAAFSTGDLDRAISLYVKSGEYQKNSKIISAWREKLAHTVSQSSDHTIGLTTNGTVVAAGDQDVTDAVKNWSQVISVASRLYEAVGLRSSGTVVYAGNGYLYEDIEDWKNIVAIDLDAELIGLKTDGTVVHTYSGNYSKYLDDVSTWRDIVAVACGPHAVGLKSDGTVVAAGRNELGECDVSGWTDIIAISAGGNITVGLKSDGTVVAVGDNKYGQCDVSAWTDIVAISAGDGFAIGLKEDGTVVHTYPDDYNEYSSEISGWSNIVAISLDGKALGLKSNGTVVYAGDNFAGEGNVSAWTNIKVPR